MSCGLKTLREWCDATLLSSCVDLRGFLLQFPEESRQRSKMVYRSLFVVNISLSFEELTAPLRHILSIHNVTINSNNLFVNFRWTFTFCVKKSYDGTHPAFGGTLDRRCHFKQVSLKQSRFYHCQTSTAHRKMIKVEGSVSTISVKNFPINLHVMYLYFPDTPLVTIKVRRSSCDVTASFDRF